MSEEERRELYDNVYSKLLTLLERCQKYVHHLNNKVKQSVAEHQQKKKIKDEPTTASNDDDIKRTGLLKKYYDMNEKTIHSRQPKLFVGSLKPCRELFFVFYSVKRLLDFVNRSISWSRMVTNFT
jgi:hypothetical protein